jgi:pimeloyl-ACP methyl ester carboxylesterase
MHMSQELNRHQMLAAMAVSASGLGGVAKGLPPDSAKLATFVLVHGAWHGGWCWKKVIPLLRAAGHEVHAPTLTGLGERAHLLNPNIDLSTHIQDITALLEYEDLRDVVLVGHSYGGMVIAGVAEKVSARLGHLVYLDAFLPENGRSMKDYAQTAPTRDDGWRVPPLGPPSAYGVTDERDVAWMTPRLGDQPLKTFTQPVSLSADRPGAVSQTFIQCTKAPFFTEAGERARRRGARYRELLSAGHDAMVTKPGELVKILIEAV